MSVIDTDSAVAYAVRHLGDQWELVLRIAEEVRDRGLELPEISDPVAVDRYIDERISAARSAEVTRQVGNIVAEIAPAQDLADSLRLGRLLEMFTPGAGPRHASAEPDTAPAALQNRVRAHLYGKALAAGPDAVPKELWDRIVALRSTTGRTGATGTSAEESGN